MTASYTYFSKNISFSPNKCLASVFNATSSPVVIKIYRVFVYNNNYTSVSGVLTNLEIRKLSAASGGTTITAISNDSNNTLSAYVNCATNATITPTDLYRRILWSTDEPSGTMDSDAFECIRSVACVWSLGYGTSLIEPITLNANEGFGIINTGASIGQCDINIEFTAA